MYKVNMTNPSEIRMGSPYNIADVELTGEFVPDLLGADFQDVYCINENGDSVALVQWRIENNQPGFNLWLISSKAKSVKKSARIIGVCEKVWFVDDSHLKVIIAKDNKRENLEIFLYK